MNIVIRNERVEDYSTVEKITREAFWNLYFPGCEEHVAVNKLRGHKDFIPELTFVIEVDGEIKGSIFYSHSKVIGENGSEYNTISFGPVSIDPKMHRMGLGRKLIEYSIEEAKKKGYKGILTLGYEYHYAPYGFVGAKKYNISMEDGKFYKGLLALPLCDGGLDNISGYAKFTTGLEVTAEEVEEFDKLFEYKEKKVQESQKIFAETVGLLDE